MILEIFILLVEFSNLLTIVRKKTTNDYNIVINLQYKKNVIDD